MEQIDNVQDGLIIQGCHPAMAMKLIGDLLIPRGNVDCKFGNLLVVRLIYNNLLALTTPEHPKTSSYHTFVQQECLVMVAFIVVHNMTAHHLTILCVVAQIDIASRIRRALLALHERVVGMFLYSLTIFDPGAFCPAATTG